VKSTTNKKTTEVSLTVLLQLRNLVLEE